MPAEIASLAAGLLRDPVRVEIAREEATAPKIAQSVRFVTTSGKQALLAELLNEPDFKRVLVFTRTKHGANKVAERLEATGVQVDAIHGNKSQPQRERALRDFRNGRARVLVATDIAARGIDVTGVSHVINFDLPAEPESYVHRIGRTARAGAEGIAIAFCDPARAVDVAPDRETDGREDPGRGGHPARDPSVPSAIAAKPSRRSGTLAVAAVRSARDALGRLRLKARGGPLVWRALARVRLIRSGQFDLSELLTLASPALAQRRGRDRAVCPVGTRLSGPSWSRVR